MWVNNYSVMHCMTIIIAHMAQYKASHNVVMTHEHPGAYSLGIDTAEQCLASQLAGGSWPWLVGIQRASQNSFSIRMPAVSIDCWLT